MKKVLAILLTVAMIVPMLTVFFALGAAAAEGAAQYATVDVSATEQGLRFPADPEDPTGNGYAEGHYRSTKKLTEVPLTYQAWVYIPANADSTKSLGVIIGNNAGQGTYGNASVSLEIASGYIPMLRCITEQGQTTEFRSNQPLPTDRWTMLTVVYDFACAEARFYYNGAIVYSYPISTSSGVRYAPPLDAHYIGHYFSLGGDRRTIDDKNFFKGGLQDVALYSTARTASEISADYQSYVSGKGVNVKDSELICYYDVDAGSAQKDVSDATGNGYTMYYSKTWLTEAEMAEARRAAWGSSFTPAYSLAAISDIQRTTIKEAQAGTLPENSVTYGMHQWLAQNGPGTSLNIQMMMSMGDITDANKPEEWAYVKEAIYQLNGVMPYTLIQGNHDGNMHQYFGADDPNSTNDYIDQFTNGKGGLYAGSVNNAFYLLTVGATEWLILALDYAPKDDVLIWAGNICAQHPNHNVIVTTHAYLNADGEPLTHGGLAPTPNTGADIWNEFASQHKNIKMILSGHVGSDTLVTTQIKGKYGNTVTQMLIDAQTLDGKLVTSGEKGLGLVTLLRFNADGTKCYVENYSTTYQRYLLGSNQFMIDLNANCEEPDYTWDGFSAMRPSGTGTEQNPYLISNGGHLLWMANETKTTSLVDFDGMYFKQICDIDLKGYSILSIGDYFKDETAMKAFGGHYDGGGYTIKNGIVTPITIDIYFNKRKSWGLFGCIYGATIKNVTLEDMQIMGRGITGAIVGKAAAPWDGSAGTDFNQVIGCHVGEGVEIMTWHPQYTHSVQGVQTKYTYDDYWRAGYVGGVCGMAYATTIRGCTAANTISVTGHFGMVGGIVSAAGYNTVIDHCAFTGGIELKDSSQFTTISMGGIVALLSPSTIAAVDEAQDASLLSGTLHITNCYNSGFYRYTGTTALNQNVHWGGIIGHAGAMFNIEPTEEMPYPYLIENCYNLYAKTLVVEETISHSNIGGIVGRSFPTGTIGTNTFWVKNSGSVTVEVGNTSGYGFDGTALRWSTNPIYQTADGLWGITSVKDGNGKSTVKEVAANTKDPFKLDVHAINVEIARIQARTEDKANIWIAGQGAPTGAANAGDMYFDAGNGDIWQYTTKWVQISNIMGPQGATGPQGPQGPQGTPGTDGDDGTNGTNGTKWYTGNGAPASTDGVATGDLYLDLSNGDVYKYTTTWEKIGNIKGATGEPGAPGQNGTNGNNGADGNKWYVGTAAPTASDDYNDGDMYYNKTTNMVYQYQNGDWVEIGSIKGDQGIQGPQGAPGTDGDDGTNGTNGTKWYTGETDTPNVSDPNEGDMYMNTTSGAVQRFDGTSWVSAGNLTGPEGLKGDKGDTGETGATGPQGPQGETGATGAQGEKGDKGDKGDKGENGADAASSDSANAAGGSNTAGDAAASSENGGNGLAIAAIVIAVVIGGANAALLVVLLLKKKKAA